jgi:hypothetical protein
MGLGQTGLSHERMILFLEFAVIFAVRSSLSRACGRSRGYFVGLSSSWTAC